MVGSSSLPNHMAFRAPVTLAPALAVPVSSPQALQGTASHWMWLEAHALHCRWHPPLFWVLSPQSSVPRLAHCLGAQAPFVASLPLPSEWGTWCGLRLPHLEPCFVPCNTQAALTGQAAPSWQEQLL